METWTLEHPELGLIEVERGYDSEFARLYPDWPQTEQKKSKKDKEKEEVTEAAQVATEPDFIEPGPNAKLPERVKRYVANPSPRLQLKVNGEPRARYATVSNGRIAIEDAGDLGTLTPTYTPVNRAKAHIYIQANFLKGILNVEYRKGSQVVEFAAPTGSRGEKRRQEMEDSAFKRVAYPLMAGLGKGGWALAVLILGPVLGRIVEWILSFFPDLNLRLPSFDINLPDLPQIALPVPNLPSLPDFDIPEPPEWVLFLLEYSKIWVPILIGLVIGILAIRNHRKSEAEKAKWQDSTDPEDVRES